MNKQNRFQDENLLLSNFYQEVWIVCPACAKKAIAKVKVIEEKAEDTVKEKLLNGEISINQAYKEIKEKKSGKV